MCAVQWNKAVQTWCGPKRLLLLSLVQTSCWNLTSRCPAAGRESQQIIQPSTSTAQCTVGKIGRVIPDMYIGENREYDSRVRPSHSIVSILLTALCCLAGLVLASLTPACNDIYLMSPVPLLPPHHTRCKGLWIMDMNIIINGVSILTVTASRLY